MQNEKRHSLQVDGRTRTFITIGPADASDLVLIFPGSTQNASKHREFTGRTYDRLAAQGAQVAYLDGYRGNWNDARRESYFPARKDEIDDVGFARAVIRELGATRVFAVGYSNGGQMVMRLIHEAPELLDGAAVVAATMPTPDSFLLPSPAAQPVALPILLIHGTADPIVPYRGGPMKWWMQKLFKVGGSSLSMPDTAAYFAAHNGITAAPVTTALPANSTTTSVERTDFRAPERHPVVLFTIHNGGHTVPHPGRASSFFVGKTSQDIDTADLVAEHLMAR